MTLLDELRTLAKTAGPPGEAIGRRLDEPLRVAIVGRVNAGKSTLLNALVGDRLAATDSTERTLLPTWYRHGTRYRTTAVMADGTVVEIPHHRDGGRLTIDTSGLGSSVAHLEVEWPASGLEQLTLIDTPGLDGAAGAGEVDADAVLVLMRHRHVRDASFLESFTRSAAGIPTAASAIAIVSRADEFGDGGDAAFATAARAAAQIAADGRIGPLCADVLPIAGLLAEAAALLTEADVAVLASVAGLDASDRTAALASVDRFRSAAVTVPAAERHRVLVRLGMAGTRIAVEALADQQVAGAGDLAALLIDRSGIPQLRRSLTARFSSRSDALRAVSAIDALRSIGGLEREVERLEAGADELVGLRLAGLLAAGLPGVRDADARALRRLVGSGSAGEHLGVASREAAVAEVARWRGIEADPIADPALIEAARLAARLAEGIHAELV